MPNIRHTFVNPAADQTGFLGTKPSDWNSTHQYTDASGNPSGTVAFLREVLTGNRTYFVRTDGDDANTGLVNSAGGAWLTWQHAYNYVANNLDIAGFKVTLQAGQTTPTFTDDINAFTALVGGGTLSIDFNGGTWSVTGGTCYQQSGGMNPTQIAFSNITFHTITSGSAIFANTPVTFNMNSGVNYGACVGPTVQLSVAGASILHNSAFTISGGSNIFLAATDGAVAQIQVPVTFTGTPNFSTCWIYAATGGVVEMGNMTVSSGTMTGQSFQCAANGVIGINGANPVTFFPGNSAGTISSGGVVI